MFVRAFQRVVAKIGIAAVLFTQLAVAVYACPELTGKVENTQVAMANEQPSTMTGSCEKLDAENPNLCQQHCHMGNQTATGAANVSVPMAMPMLLTVVEPLQPVSALKLTTLPVLRERETGPPPLIRFHVFRI